MIKNIIFDIGNVILNFNINEVLQKFTSNEVYLKKYNKLSRMVRKCFN